MKEECRDVSRSVDESVWGKGRRGIGVRECGSAA